MKLKFYCDNERGLTLVEFIIAFALIVFVLAVGYCFYFFGMRSFAVGETQSNMQRDIRLVANFITKETRNATEIYLIGTPVPSAADGFHYIYLESSAFRYKNPGGTVTEKTGPFINELSPMFKLKLSNERNLLEFTINGQDESQTYTLDTQVLLYNVSNLAEAQNQALKYKKP